MNNPGWVSKDATRAAREAGFGFALYAKQADGPSGKTVFRHAGITSEFTGVEVWLVDGKLPDDVIIIYDEESYL